jgi:hypothetical protein
VFVGFLDLFWTREAVRESLSPEVLYLFPYAFILFVVNRNAIVDVFIFYCLSKCACVSSVLL